MVLGPSGRVHDSQNQLCLTLGPPNGSNSFKQNPKTFLKDTCFVNLKNLEIQSVHKIGKDRARNPDNPSEKFLKILHGVSISSRKHEMELFEDLKYGIRIYQKTCNGTLVIWDQHLSNI